MEYIIFENIKFYKTIYEGYFISKCGKFISCLVKGGKGKVDYGKPRYHNVKIDKDGYKIVCISKNSFNGKSNKYISIHRLVYETFVCKIPNDKVVDHIDNDKLNNNVDNLQLLTPQQNSIKSCAEKYIVKINNDVEFEVEGFREMSKILGVSASSLTRHYKRGCVRPKSNNCVDLYKNNNVFIVKV